MATFLNMLPGNDAISELIGDLGADTVEEAKATLEAEIEKSLTNKFGDDALSRLDETLGSGAVERLKEMFGAGLLQAGLVTTGTSRIATVRPGDLITAELMNQIIKELTRLQVRVKLLEGRKPPKPGKEPGKKLEGKIEVRMGKLEIRGPKLSQVEVRVKAATNLPEEFEFSTSYSAVKPANKGLIELWQAGTKILDAETDEEIAGAVKFEAGESKTFLLRIVPPEDTESAKVQLHVESKSSEDPALNFHSSLYLVAPRR